MKLIVSNRSYTICCSIRQNNDHFLFLLAEKKIIKLSFFFLKTSDLTYYRVSCIFYKTYLPLEFIISNLVAYLRNLNYQYTIHLLCILYVRKYILGCSRVTFKAPKFMEVVTFVCDVL